MSEMSKSDTELAYKYLNDRVRGDVEHSAYSKTLNTWRDERPDDLDALEDANDDDESSFDWEGIGMQFETHDPERGDELVPMTGMEPEDDRDVYDLALAFGKDYIEAVRAEIRALQEDTILSPREFVAIVLYYQVPEERAAGEMGISVGNYRGKIGKVSEKRDRSEATMGLSKSLASTR